MDFYSSYTEHSRPPMPFGFGYDAGRASIPELQSRADRNPQDFYAFEALGCALMEAGQHLQALIAFGKALEIDASEARTHYHFALMCRKMNQFAMAISHFNHAIKRQPDFSEAYTQMALLLIEQHQYPMAEKVLLMGLEFKPYHPDLIGPLISLKIDLGDKSAAHQLCTETLNRHPANSLLFSLLVGLEMLSPDDPLVAYSEKHYAENLTVSQQRANTGFALAQVYDAAENYAKAFSYYQSFHRDRAALYAYDEKATSKTFATLKKLAPAPIQETVTNSNAPAPLFILGMPRSGTSLVEEMLSSHSQVHGGGELPALHHIIHAQLCVKANQQYPQALGVLDTEQPSIYAEAAKVYHQQLQTLSPQSQFVSDKMPHNFLNIGLILRMFPNARIIHCRRNPVDTCFSIFTNNFAGDHRYANDLTALGRYYRLYDDLMQHWESLYPGQIHHVQYEALVTDTEAQLRAMLNYCGLEWEAECMAFHTRKRVVTTSSHEQVRKPIYTTSIGAWKRYEDQLKPLIKALGDLAD